jgi:site-specific DNA-cytosine methylase
LERLVTVVDDVFIDSCGFRMFDLAEIARTMVMADHPRGGAYAIKGNKRERMAKYGNAVTPPASQLILSRVAESLGGGFTILDLFCGAGGSAIGAVAAGGELVLAHTQPSFVQVTETRPALVEIPE